MLHGKISRSKKVGNGQQNESKDKKRVESIDSTSFITNSKHRQNLIEITKFLNKIRYWNIFRFANTQKVNGNDSM